MQVITKVVLNMDPCVGTNVKPDSQILLKKLLCRSWWAPVGQEKVYGANTIDKSNVHRWMKKFKPTLKKKSGRPFNCDKALWPCGSVNTKIIQPTLQPWCYKESILFFFVNTFINSPCLLVVLKCVSSGGEKVHFQIWWYNIIFLVLFMLSFL